MDVVFLLGYRATLSSIGLWLKKSLRATIPRLCDGVLLFYTSQLLLYAQFIPPELVYD